MFKRWFRIIYNEHAQCLFFFVLFQEYIKSIETKFDWSELSYFELNLETWRQLWRVLEMADIVLFITDIRFPVRMMLIFNYIVDR